MYQRRPYDKFKENVGRKTNGKKARAALRAEDALRSVSQQRKWQSVSRKQAGIGQVYRPVVWVDLGLKGNIRTNSSGPV